MKRLSVILVLMAFVVVACDPASYFDKRRTEPESPQWPDEEKEADKPYTESGKYGVTYIYDGSVIPEIHLHVAKEQWNELLKLYDANHNTKQYIHCDATYVKGGDVTTVKDAGLRLRGNTSRRHPGSNGSYRHVHFGLDFHKFNKDEAHEIHGARKINLKWFKEDPSYVREIYCFDLFRRDTVWTAVHAEYCRLWLKVNGDSRESYLGVYQMQEPVDTRYLKERKDAFGGADGNLWKCRYGATLSSADDRLFGLDTGTDQEWVYECKTDDNDFNAAKAQLKDFITKAKNMTGDGFHDWLEKHCDVPLLLRTYAVNVACGMWDDYWNNCNNYYIYFNSADADAYTFFFIPYDYDNTLGTCNNCGAQSDAARQDPLHWGTDGNYLIKKILGYSDWESIYKQELLKLSSDKESLLSKTASAGRIITWQQKIADYVSNDTGEDMKIEDRPASWGSHGEYRLLTDGENNFFKVKIETINKYCK